MADISKISLPSGTEYNLKDASARSDLAGKQDTIGTEIILSNTENFLTAAENEYGLSYEDLVALPIEELLAVIAELGVNEPQGSAGTVTSVGLVNATNGGLSISGSPITSSGTITVGLATGYGDTKNPYASKTKNYVLAAPSTANGVPTFRKLVEADIPDLSGTYLTSYTETDPTVPSWAKASTKPTYTASEVGAAPVSHTHGHISSDGKISTHYAISNGDRLIITHNKDDTDKLAASSITFGTSTTQYLANNGTWVNMPTIPSITLNGSASTSPNFYAPTTAGTSGYYLKSNGSGAPTWAAVTAGVSDVTVAGTSVVTNSVAVIAAPVQIVRW